ncbi:MAG: hypothetical protein BGO01_09935 [Armatimonadetes bacterium 55-13]|nr:hypothetical protein [Armatimonadota bacterium]OJU62722.1 MAG: hypothetical protein BGO01_09935 [Armatimonadetes bacterium 55-13]
MPVQWNAKWISHVYDPREDLGVFLFRSKLKLSEIPETLYVKVSADNRYKLYVNGELVSFGPQRGDTLHWFYETIDLSPKLKTGDNEIVAVVWNFGWLAPMAQISVRTAFVFDVVGQEFPDLNTPGNWKVAKLEGWTFEMMHSGIEQFYTDIGPGEIIDGSKHPDALGLASESLGWRDPHVVYTAVERGAGYSTPWNLVPRSIPPMRYAMRPRPPLLRHGFVGDTITGQDGDRLSEGFVLQAGQSILLDFEELLCAYPRFQLSGQAGSTVTLTYAEGTWPAEDESPWTSKARRDRDVVRGRMVRGYQDKLILGEGVHTFETLWWRTFRYVHVHSDGPLTIHGLTAVETGYPIEAESSFECDRPEVDKIWEVALRTVERCAGETYFDCPYYEQLQYVGDTRIQALIGYYLGKDRDLQRNAIETLGWSRMSNGLTRSRYPDRQPQIIPPFSLWWVLMRQDQRLYDRIWQTDPEDDDPIDSEGLDVANAFNRLSSEAIDRTFWNFVDWVPGWEGGTPPGSARATVNMLTLYLAHLATEISLDSIDRADPRRVQALAHYILPQFEKTGGLVRHRNDPDWIASEHAEALYRCVQQRLGLPLDPWPYDQLEKAGAARCTYYFSYYKHLTMQPDDYISELGPWREMIEENLTTFAENPPPVRSDCHAWSSHPILGLFQVVAGVTSAGEGWKRAQIAPHPGSLRRFDAKIAHPDGLMRVQFEAGKLSIETPVESQLVWQGKSAVLQPGAHSIG